MKVKEAAQLDNLPSRPDEHEEKMYYSGTCIRWLLKPIKKTKEDIDDKFLQVSDFMSIIWSKYLVRNIADKATTDLGSICRHSLTNEPSWQGYVTELEVVNLFYKRPTVDLWKKLADGKGRLVKETAATTHNYKMGALIPWVEKLQCSKVQLVVICRHQNFGEFIVVPSDFENLKELNNALKANHGGRDRFKPFDCQQTLVQGAHDWFIQAEQALQANKFKRSTIDP